MINTEDLYKRPNKVEGYEEVMSIIKSYAEITKQTKRR